MPLSDCSLDLTLISTSCHNLPIPRKHGIHPRKFPHVPQEIQKRDTLEPVVVVHHLHRPLVRLVPPPRGVLPSPFEETQHLRGDPVDVRRELIGTQRVAFRRPPGRVAYRAGRAADLRQREEWNIPRRALCAPACGSAAGRAGGGGSPRAATRRTGPRPRRPRLAR